MTVIQSNIVHSRSNVCKVEHHHNSAMITSCAEFWKILIRLYSCRSLVITMHIWHYRKRQVGTLLITFVHDLYWWLCIGCLTPSTNTVTKWSSQCWKLSSRCWISEIGMHDNAVNTEGPKWDIQLGIKYLFVCSQHVLRIL